MMRKTKKKKNRFAFAKIHFSRIEIKFWKCSLKKTNKIIPPDRIINPFQSNLLRQSVRKTEKLLIKIKLFDYLAIREYCFCVLSNCSETEISQPLNTLKGRKA